MPLFPKHHEALIESLRYHYFDENGKQMITVNFAVVDSNGVVVNTVNGNPETNFTLPYIYKELKISRQGRICAKLKEMYGTNDLIFSFDDGLVGLLNM